MAPNKEITTCLACSKKFGKSDFSVQCTVCRLWIHKGCANLKDEMFKFLDDQFKLTGTAFWACRACTQYAKQMNHKMRKIETELEKVKETCQKNGDGLKQVQDDVTKLAATVESQSKKVEEAQAAAAASSNSSGRERTGGPTSSCTGWGRHPQTTWAEPDGTGISRVAKTFSLPSAFPSRWAVYAL